MAKHILEGLMKFIRKLLSVFFWFLTVSCLIPTLGFFINEQISGAIFFLALTFVFGLIARKTWPKKSTEKLYPTSQSVKNTSSGEEFSSHQIPKNLKAEKANDQLAKFKIPDHINRKSDPTSEIPLATLKEHHDNHLDFTDDSKETDSKSNSFESTIDKNHSKISIPVDALQNHHDNLDLTSFRIQEKHSNPNVSEGTDNQNNSKIRLPLTTLQNRFDSLDLTDVQIDDKNNRSSGIWLSPTESLKISNYTINGMVYVGKHLAAFNGRGVEVSLIDSSLPYLQSSSDYQDETLGYWPSFSSISAKCRGAYLSWLSGQRNELDTPLGYVFLYFYGLERRLLIDLPEGKVSDIERDLLIHEIKRLSEVYGNSRSFSDYANSLLDYLSVVSPSESNLSISYQNTRNHSLQLKLQLSETVEKGNPISSELALMWLLGLQDYQLKTASKRCHAEFKGLFTHEYSKQYGAGLVIKPNKTRLNIHYRPASESLLGYQPIELDLPDPSNLKSPIKKLVTLANICNDKLDPYSRYIGQKANSPEDLEAQLLLPKILLEQSEFSLLEKLKPWIVYALHENSGIIKVSDLWEKLGRTPPDKINKKENDLITKALEMAGFSFAPNSKHHLIKPTPDGIIVLIAEAQGKYFEPSKAFHEIANTLRLGSTVASIDNQIKPDEVDYLKTLIDHSTHISPTEKASLHAYLIWLLNSPIRTLGIKAALGKLSNQQRIEVGDILIKVALSDGLVKPEEIKQLEKLYTALGLDKSQVTSDIHRHTSYTNATGVSYNNKDPKQSTTSGFVLDENRLRLLDNQTKEVSSFIGEIFADKNDVTTGPEASKEISKEDASKEILETESTLNPTYQPLYKMLITRESWTTEEVSELCQKHNLMAAGAIESINDWVFTLVDAAIFEDEDDNLLVDQEIKAELQELENLRW